MSAPSPAAVDAKAEEYYRLKDALDEATETAKLKTIPLVQIKAELVELVSAYGSTHAEKSKLLHGITSEMMVTFGQSVSIDAAAVERFRQALIEENYTRLHKKIFEESVHFTLAPEASAIIRGLKLPKALLALYSQCEIVKPRAPSLQVRPKSG